MSDENKKYKRILVTSALPYANGPIHIGHMAGVYIPSDIYVRYQRLRHRDVIHICGSDEHGVAITMRARKEGVTPQDIIDKYHALNKKAFEDFGISFDIYSRTSSDVHTQTSQEIFRKLYEDGKFVEKTTEQYYDEEAKQFLADRYITGTCPHCGNTGAYGDQCEKCGTSLDPTDLIDPKSAISGSKPVLKKTTHWYMPLDQYQQFLEKWILQDHKNWKVNVYGQCKSWLDQGLQPRAVSRDLDWGIPVPVEGAEGKVLYVWFDAPIGYISFTRQLTPDWEKYWKDPETKMVHFIGKDNIVFHCIVFPSILKAEGSYILPDNVPANEFLNLENDKISTSRNWAVWLHEYNEDFPGKQDVLRYVLTANATETKDNDFTWKDFQQRNNSELVAVLGNFVNRTLLLTEKYFGNVVPEPGNLTDYDKETLAKIAQIKADTEQSLELYRFREALNNAMGLGRLGNKYITEMEPWKVWKTDPERVKAILYVNLQITAAISTVLEPFIPHSTAKLRGFMNIADTFEWDTVGNVELVKPGHQLGKSALLFEPITDEVVQAQVDKLNRTKLENQKENFKPVEQKPMVSFDDFNKCDIRTATILAAEKVAKTTKLLKLTVDTGIDQRTIVSGIAEHYNPEDIVGRKILMIVNLEPRKIKGIESRGMILCATDAAGALHFLNPDAEIENGCQIG
ncbi:MAG: methionine--tRNA ligase [Bacteroidales bacterium]|nr:methionine--tRNA ligase [Bacteroidales bacterium]